MDYLPRIIEAIEFIEEHLDEGICMESVAAHVAFSEYHFHRVFTGMLGESVTEYIRKRRLAKAAKLLLFSDLPLMEIVVGSGFETQESFTRSFRKMFRVTPGRYRTLGKESSFIDKRAITTAMVKHLSRGLTLRPKIVSRPSEYVIGMGHSFGENNQSEIKSLWQVFNERQAMVPNVKGPYALGVCCTSHPRINKKNRRDSFIYLASRPVNSLDEIPDEMIGFEIPAGQYAVFTHTGNVNNLRHTVNYIWGTWLPKCSYEYVHGPDIELYNSRFNAKTGEGQIEIYVPVT